MNIYQCGVIILKKIFIGAYSYIAAVIGAGFASGQEILCYFSRYGKAGALGILISSMIFALFAYFIMNTCIITKSCSYDDFMRKTIPASMIPITRVSSGILAFAVYAVMIAAIGRLTSDITGVPSSICAALFAFFGTFMMYRGTYFIVRLNGVLGIILTIGITASCMYILRYREYHVFSPVINAAASSYIYSGYNLLPLTPVLAVTGITLAKRNSAGAVSIIAGVMLTVMMFMMYIVIAIYDNKINLGEFPMLTLAYRQNDILGSIYMFLLAGAVLTTLLSSGASIIETFKLQKKLLPAALISSIAYSVSGAGFSTLVNTAYRICGIIGAVLITMIFICCIKSIHTNKQNS